MTELNETLPKKITFWRVVRNPRLWAYTIFWLWNAIFLAFVLLGFAPLVLPSIFSAVQTNLIPPLFLVFGAVLVAIPIITVILGFTVLRKTPYKLFTLGYGVEGPLMALLAIRFFAIGQANPGITFVMIVAAIGLLTLFWHLVDGRSGRHDGWLGYVQAVGFGFLITIGLYASIWALFYAVPFTVFFFEAIGDILSDLPAFFGDIWREIRYSWREGLFFVSFLLLGVPLYFFTAVLFIALPAIVPFLYARAWWQGHVNLGRGRGAAITGSILLTCFALFVITNRQPQGDAFTLLADPPTSIAEAEALLEQEGLIRDGLINAYLSGVRYSSSNGEVYHIQDIYRDAFNLDPEQAAQVQRNYEAVAQPVLYRPANGPAQSFDNRFNWEAQARRTEPEQAAELYEAFFDESINVGEREEVVRAVRTTFDPNRALDAWQAVDEREIHLNQQELTVTPQGDWAEIELHETYQNITRLRQEVVYYFTLPESAVVTGLWLGNGPEKEFAYRVSPRGAAQQVYREQVQRNIDPALLEQIGTRQYRLRVFPIEPMREEWNDNSSPFGPQITLHEGDELHMWVSFQVMLGDEGYPLPKLSRHFNVFWDDESIRTIDGVPFENEAWLPEAIKPQTPVSPQSHLVAFPDGRIVTAIPAADGAQGANDPAKIAIVLDRSRSMVDQAEAVNAAVAQLRQLDPAADVYLTSSEVRGEPASMTVLNQFDSAEVVYYGGQNAAELIQQFNSLNPGNLYDAVFVLTDDSSYSLSDEGLELVVPDSPVWVIHLNGIFPDGYDDETLQAIQASGGGSADTVDEALTRIGIGRTGFVDLVDGYRWEVHSERPAGEFIEHLPTDPFAAFAARRLILAEMIAQRASITDLDTLDQLHALAIEHSLVTPYSSMIVLVNQQQENRLDQLENQEDRFDREFEDVGETAPPVTGVPEPHEWLLIFLSAGLLGWYWMKQKRPEQGIA